MGRTIPCTPFLLSKDSGDPFPCDRLLTRVCIGFDEVPAELDFEDCETFLMVPYLPIRQNAKVWH